MTLTARTLAVAVVALCGASVASAQNSIGVRPVTVAAPRPAFLVQQDMMWQNAYRQAQLWQMYQPPVVVLNNQFPYDPWGQTALPGTGNPWGPTVTRNPWGPTLNQPGAMWNSNNNFYRNNYRPWPHQPGGLRVIR